MRTHNEFTMIDLFAGAGGLSEGLRGVGFRCLYANEIKRSYSKTYAINHPNAAIDQRDIRIVDARFVVLRQNMWNSSLGLLRLLLVRFMDKKGFQEVGVVSLVGEEAGEPLLEVVPGGISGVATRKSVHLDQPYQPVALERGRPNEGLVPIPHETTKNQKTFNDGVISGVCTLKPITSGPVICCPIRLYAENYIILRRVSLMAFGDEFELVPGRKAVLHAKTENRPCIAVFGKRWGGELRLPQKSGRGGYFVDWVLAKLNRTGDLEEFVAVEVQAIDTTGNYRNGFLALKESRSLVRTTAGLNWENVSKRILPQLIYKGQVLQREALCKKGLFFVCPEPVFERITNRLGGIESLVRYTLQPASITFAAFDHDIISSSSGSGTVPLKETQFHSTTVYKVQEAFNNVTLPEENVYRDAILKALGKEGISPIC